LRKTEAQAGLLGLEMAEGNGQGVGSVGRLWYFAHLEQGANHNLDLALIGVAVTRHAGFHFAGRVTVNGDAVLGGSEKHDTANFSEAEGGAHVEGGKNGFDGESVGREFVEKAAEERVNVMKHSAEEFFLALRRDTQCTIVQHAAGAAVGLDDAVASWTGGGGIHTENAEGAVFRGCHGRGT
jgi:hypothetical protein